MNMRPTRRSLRNPFRGLLAGLVLVLMPFAARPSPEAPSSPGTRPALAALGPSARGVHAGGFEKAYVIPIQDTINDVTLDSVKRRLDAALDDGADLVIFDIDTPGGDAFACLQICTEIKNLTTIHTIAWVNHQAYSAGAIISMACDEIVMSPRSTLGDSQPIFLTPGGPSAVPDDIEAKVTSPLIEEVRDSARRRGYDMTLCLAMIDPTIEVFWLEHAETGERRFVDRAGRDELFAIGPSAGPERTVTRSVKPGGSPDPLTGQSQDVVETTTKIEPGEHVAGSESKTAWRYVQSDERLGTISQPIDSSKQLLTMSQDEAVAFGFATGIVADRAEFRSRYGIVGAIEDLPYNWSEELADWLGSATVRGVLLMLIILGGYVELKTPGVGLPGLVAVIALAVFLGAPYLTGLANVWEILVVLAGIVLILVELFVLPGFGIAGISGLILIFAGMLLSFMPAEPGGPIPFHWPRFEYTLTGLRDGLIAMSVSMLASLAAAMMLSRYLPRIPVFGRVVAPNPTPADIAAGDPYGNLARIGDVGVTEGVLRPAGKARFGQVLVDVVTEGDYIEPGAQIEVIERHGNRVVVRPFHV